MLTSIDIRSNENFTFNQLAFFVSIFSNYSVEVIKLALMKNKKLIFKVAIISVGPWYNVWVNNPRSRRKKKLYKNENEIGLTYFRVLLLSFARFFDGSSRLVLHNALLVWSSFSAQLCFGSIVSLRDRFSFFACFGAFSMSSTPALNIDVNSRFQWVFGSFFPIKS